MKNIEFAGGSGFVAQSGAQNPLAAMMAKEICEQINKGGAPLEASKANGADKTPVATNAAQHSNDKGASR